MEGEEGDRIRRRGRRRRREISGTEWKISSSSLIHPAKIIQSLGFISSAPVYSSSHHRSHAGTARDVHQLTDIKAEVVMCQDARSPKPVEVESLFLIIKKQRVGKAEERQQQSQLNRNLDDIWCRMNNRHFAL